MPLEITILDTVFNIEFLLGLILGAWCGFAGSRVSKARSWHDTIDHVTLGAFWASCVIIVRDFYPGSTDKDYLWLVGLIVGSVFANRAINEVGSRFLRKINNGKTGDK